MTLTPLPENILNVYASASPAQVRAGLAWYGEAFDLATELDPNNPLRAAGIIAALSPRQRWNGNKTLARKAFSTGPLGMWRDKVAALLEFPDITEGEILAILNGEKISNFYLNIVYRGNVDFVTVDMHAFDIAVGQVTDEKSRATLSRKGVYAEFADAYREAAAIAQLPPPHLQAITWVAWRDALRATNPRVAA